MSITDPLTRLVWLLQKIPADQLHDVLQDLMTPQEISELAERIELLHQLKQGKTQREIASDMGISVTTVSRGNRVLKYGKWVIGEYVG